MLVRYVISPESRKMAEFPLGKKKKKSVISPHGRLLGSLLTDPLWETRAYGRVTCISLER